MTKPSPGEQFLNQERSEPLRIIRSSWQASRVLSLAVLLWLGMAVAAEAAGKSKNPFMLPDGVFSAENLPPQEEQVLVLQAVVQSDHGRVATINDQNFLPGDIVNGKTVVEIQADKVILGDQGGGARQTLTLKQSSFPLAIKKKP